LVLGFAYTTNPDVFPNGTSLLALTEYPADFAFCLAIAMLSVEVKILNFRFAMVCSPFYYFGSFFSGV